MIAGEPILDGAHDGHGPHADDQRGGDKAVDKAAVAFIAHQALEPLAQGFHAGLNVERFARKAAQHQRKDKQHGVLGAHRAVFHL